MCQGNTIAFPPPFAKALRVSAYPIHCDIIVMFFFNEAERNIFNVHRCKGDQVLAMFPHPTECSVLLIQWYEPINHPTEQCNSSIVKKPQTIKISYSQLSMYQ